MNEQELIDAALSEVWNLYDQAMAMQFWQRPVASLALLRQAQIEYDKLSDAVKQSETGRYWGQQITEEISKAQS